MRKIYLIIFLSIVIISEAFAVPSFKQEISLADDTDELRGINFKPDGTIMYITRRISPAANNDPGRRGFINQYSLSTPFDISTAILISETQLTEPGETDSEFAFLPHAIEFKPDGTRMFVIKNTGTLVFQYDLSTPWDVSTISFDTKYDVSGEDQLRSLDFKPDGSRMYVTGNEFEKIKEYSLTTPWDVTTSNVTHVRDSVALTSTDDNPRNIQFSERGTELYYAGNGSNDMHKFTLSTAWDVSTLSSSATTFDLGDDRIDNMRGFIFTSSFSRLYVTNDNGKAAFNKIFEYSLSCATTISCEDASKDENVVALIESQVELSKRVIKHNTLPIMRRVKWLRRHKNYDDLNNLQAEISFSDQRLAKLVETIKPNLKREKRKKNDEWFQWNEGKIGIGRTNAKSGSLSRRVHTTGFTIGADKKKNEDLMHGYAFQFGTENIDVIHSLSGIFAKTYALSFYRTKLVESHLFTNSIIGISHIDLDTKREENNTMLEGSRNGNQIYGTINLGKRINLENYNLSPNIKLDLGYTMLDEFKEENEFGTSADVLLFKKHEILTSLATVGLLLDKSIRHYEDRIINHTGRFEYIIDFSPSSDADFHYANDPSTKFSINIDEEAHQNFRIGYGFDVTYETGWSLIANFERFHAISSGYVNEIYFSAGYVPTEDIKYALAFENQKASLNYNKYFNGFAIKLGSKYDLLSEIPEYRLTIDAVTKF